MNRAETLRTLPAGADLAGAPRRLRVPVAAAEVHDLAWASRVRPAGERPGRTRKSFVTNEHREKSREEKLLLDEN